jgi:1-acyl-sn-glycerol-3-phosphate acyltransferase
MNWRCLFFIPIFVLATIAMGLVSSVVAIFDRSGKISHYFARYWSRFIFWGVGIKVKLTGVENIPANQAVIFAANHQSTMDIPAMFGYLPVQFRIMAKKILFMIPFLGWHLFLSGNIPIDRKNAKQAFEGVFKATARIRKGISLLVFVEGTRSRDGKLHRFKRGTFTLAKKLQAPIVPVAIKGTYELMPANAWTARGGLVEIEILPAVPFTAESQVDEMSSVLRSRLISAGLVEAQ